MLRFQSHNPRQFIDILLHGGCELRHSNARIQTIINPARPGLYSMVRMDQPVHPEMRAAHLENLGISEDEFFAWFESYRPPS